MSQAMHLPLIELSVGDRVQFANPDAWDVQGKVTEVFHTKPSRTGKCPLTTWYRVEWDDNSMGWYYRRDLRPL